jgi:hypothetical protein
MWVCRERKRKRERERERNYGYGYGCGYSLVLLCRRMRRGRGVKLLFAALEMSMPTKLDPPVFGFSKPQFWDGVWREGHGPNAERGECLGVLPLYGSLSLLMRMR